MSVDKRVPDIRFKGFSGEWDTYRLGDIASVERGKFSVRPRNDPRYFGGNIPFVQTGDIVSANRTLKRFSQTLNQKGLSVSKLFPKNTILMTIAANIGDLAITDFDVACTDSVVAINTKNNFSFAFIFDALRLKKSSLEAAATTNAQANINLQILNPLRITAPALKEQTQIGNYFQKLDNLINQHQQKHDKLSSIKKSMLEKMFPKQGETIPEIRFKGFGGEWAEKDLINEVELFSGLTYSPKDIQKEGTLVIRSSNVKNGQLVQADNVYVNSEVVNCSNVIEGDVIVVVRNGSRSLIGKHAQVNSCMNNTVIGAFMTGIRSKQPEFINSLFDTNKFTAEVEKNLGATINQITNGAFKKMVFMFPAEDEQRKIGKYFQKLDTLINQHQQQITKLNNIKQACLSKMFV